MRRGGALAIVAAVALRGPPLPVRLPRRDVRRVAPRRDADRGVVRRGRRRGDAAERRRAGDATARGARRRMARSRRRGHAAGRRDRGAEASACDRDRDTYLAEGAPLRRVRLRRHDPHANPGVTMYQTYAPHPPTNGDWNCDGKRRQAVSRERHLQRAAARAAATSGVHRRPPVRRRRRRSCSACRRAWGSACDGTTHHAAAGLPVRPRGGAVPELPDIEVYVDAPAAPRRRAAARARARREPVPRALVRSAAPRRPRASTCSACARIGKRIVFDLDGDLHLVST